MFPGLKYSCKPYSHFCEYGILKSQKIKDVTTNWFTNRDIWAVEKMKQLE